MRWCDDNSIKLKSGFGGFTTWIIYFSWNFHVYRYISITHAFTSNPLIFFLSYYQKKFIILLIFFNLNFSIFRFKFNFTSISSYLHSYDLVVILELKKYEFFFNGFFVIRKSTGINRSPVKVETPVDVLYIMLGLCLCRQCVHFRVGNKGSCLLCSKHCWDRSDHSKYVSVSWTRVKSGVWGQ